MNLSFSELQLHAPILRALDEQKYQTPTPIQIRAIPHLLEGRDLLGVSQTGTGKTAAFGLPILQRLSESQGRTTGAPRALVLTPTRELALQIADSLRAYGRHLPLRHAVVFGGVSQKPQTDALRRGVDILVATPGRLLDLMNQGQVRLESISIFVLDEADRMLDLGFLPQVKRIVAKLPKERQTLLFSATMPADIAQLADGILRRPVRVEATPVASTVEQVDQCVLFVATEDKRPLLGELLKDPRMARCLVFVRTKHGADRVAKQLTIGGIAATALHGNKSQAARQRTLESFRAGRLRVLVATDIVARGIDVDGISHVVNFDLPHVPEDYVHRIGRTARAGATGIALAFCDGGERPLLREIEKLTKRPLRVIADHPFAGRIAQSTPAPRKPAGAPQSRYAPKAVAQRRLGRSARSANSFR